MFKTTQSRFTATMIAFFVALLLVTVWVINQFVAPQLVDSESRLVRYQVNSLASGIVEQMNRVQAQQRAITETERQFAQADEHGGQKLRELLTADGNNHIFRPRQQVVSSEE